MSCDPIDGHGERAKRSGAHAVGDPYRMKTDKLCDSEDLPADYPRDMCAVAVTVAGSNAIADKVLPSGNPAAEIRMCASDPRVDHIRMHAQAGFTVGIEVVQRQGPPVHALPTSGPHRLAGLPRDRLVRLHPGHFRHPPPRPPPPPPPF